MANKNGRPRRDENRLLSALSHPLRRQILRQMREVDSISPIDMAAEFKLPVSNVAYHVRVLAECGAITLVDTEPVRGAVKHFYRYSIGTPWANQIIDLEPSVGPTADAA